MADTEAPREERYDVDGLELATLEWGDARAPLALLLHGYPDTAWTWRHLGPRLAARGWHAVAPFSRGYAPSAVPHDGGYRLADLAADALALRDRLAPGRRAVLVGHDWGAVSTWFITRHAPESFARYVAMSVPPPPALFTTARGTGGPGRFARQLRRSWYFLYNQLPVQGRLERRIPAHWRVWSPGYDADEDVARVLAALDTSERRTAALSYYRDNLRGGALATFTVRPRAPALYLHGTGDGCIGIAVAGTGESLLAPGSRFTPVPGTGHFLQLEAPERVGELIEAWIGPADA